MFLVDAPGQKLVVGGALPRDHVYLNVVWFFNFPFRLHAPFTYLAVLSIDFRRKRSDRARLTLSGRVLQALSCRNFTLVIYMPGFICLGCHVSLAPRALTRFPWLQPDPHRGISQCPGPGTKGKFRVHLNSTGNALLELSEKLYVNVTNRKKKMLSTWTRSFLKIPNRSQVLLLYHLY